MIEVKVRRKLGKYPQTKMVKRVKKETDLVLFRDKTVKKQ